MKQLIILLLLISSCTSDRICRKALKKGCYKVDSVIVKDTLILTDYDTMVKFDTLNEVDTLYAENNGIKTLVFTKWKTREVRVVQKADTIIKERKVPQIQVKQLDCPKQKWWDTIGIGMLLMNLIYLAIALIIRQILKSLGSKPDNNTF